MGNTEINEDNSKRGIGRRDFLSTSALTTVGFVASSALLSPFAHAHITQKNNNIGISKSGQGPFSTKGMAAYSSNGKLKLMTFNRRALGANDVAIKLHYCGVCHSDIHTIRGDWGKVHFPLIVGHELA